MEPAVAANPRFLDLQRHLQKLRDQLATLQQSLGAWQRWDASYEWLKEEVAAVPFGDAAALARVRDTFSSDPITSRDLGEIFTAPAAGTQAEQRPRTREQVAAVIDRRLEYVGRNVETLKREAAAAEERLDKSETLLNAGELDGEDEGQEQDEGPDQKQNRSEPDGPFMDIVEELDDDDNVVSFRLQRPEDAERQISATLARAGIIFPEEEGKEAELTPELLPIREKPAPADRETTASGGKEWPAERVATMGAGDIKESRNDTKENSSSSTLTRAEVETATTSQFTTGAEVETAATGQPTTRAEVETATTSKPTTRVRFATDTKEGDDSAHSEPEDENPDQRDDYMSPDKTDQPMSRRAKRLAAIMQTAREQEDNMNRKRPILPANESEEDAALRREMLQYSMGEMGAVVAEMDIEEDDSATDSDSDPTIDQEEEDVDEDDEEDEEDDDDYGDYEDEDQYGRSRQPVVTDAYRQRMRALEKKYGIKSAQSTQGTDKDGSKEPSIKEEGIGRIAVRPEEDRADPAPASKPSNTDSTARGQKKGVRFAETLDVAPDDEMGTTETGPTPPVDPLGDVVERSSGPQDPTTRQQQQTHKQQQQQERPPARKVSRFKQALAAGTPAGDGFEPPPPSAGPLDAPARFLDRDGRDGVADVLPPVTSGKILADAVVEREPSLPALSRAVYNNESESYDGAEQGLREQYHRLRNKFIHREGGFLKENDEPIIWEDSGPPVSRFKAARLSRQ